MRGVQLCDGVPSWFEMELATEIDNEAPTLRNVSDCGKISWGWGKDLETQVLFKHFCFHQTEGSNVTLECVASGSPEPEVGHHINLEDDIMISYHDIISYHDTISI